MPLPDFTLSFLSWFQEAEGRYGWAACARKRSEGQPCELVTSGRVDLLLLGLDCLAANPRAHRTVCCCSLGASLEDERVRVSNGALLLPSAFPAAEEEAEAGLRGESGALSGRDELFGEEAMPPSATGTEEEREA